MGEVLGGGAVHHAGDDPPGVGRLHADEVLGQLGEGRRVPPVAADEGQSRGEAAAGGLQLAELDGRVDHVLRHAAGERGGEWLGRPEPAPPPPNPEDGEEEEPGGRRRAKNRERKKLSP